MPLLNHPRSLQQVGTCPLALQALFQVLLPPVCVAAPGKDPEPTVRGIQPTRADRHRDSQDSQPETRRPGPPDGVRPGSEAFGLGRAGVQLVGRDDGPEARVAESRAQAGRRVVHAFGLDSRGSIQPPVLLPGSKGPRPAWPFHRDLLHLLRGIGKVQNPHAFGIPSLGQTLTSALGVRRVDVHRHSENERMNPEGDEKRDGQGAAVVGRAARTEGSEG